MKKEQQNKIIQAALMVGAIIAIVSYFFNYFSLPIVGDALDMFVDTDFDSFGMIQLLSLGQDYLLSEPLAIVAIVFLFALPVLLLLASIVLQLIDLITSKLTFPAAIAAVISAGYLLVANLFIGIFLKIASSNTLDEIASGLSSFLPDIFSVGVMWWVQLVMAVGSIVAAILLLVNSKTKKEIAPEDVALIGIKGQYSGCTFKIDGNDRFILGRDPSVCNVIFSESESKISRRHCEIHYDFDKEKYVVTDYSSNGTYVTNGSQKNKLQKGKPIFVAARLFLEIGNENNIFKLN